jgi:hypothetical protein
MGLILACGDDAPHTEPVGAGSGGEASGAAGEGGAAAEAGSAGSLMSNYYCSGSPWGSPPSAHVEALSACDVEEPCERSNAQLVELDGHYMADNIACLLSAFAERRVGRYRYETDSTWGNANVGAFHTLLVHGDGAVSYVRETYQCVESTVPVDELPPAEPYTCTLKPPTYFEACLAAIEALEGREPYPPLGTGIAAWACAFGDGDGYTPNNLFWFESCVSDMPLSCD